MATMPPLPPAEPRAPGPEPRVPTTSGEPALRATSDEPRTTTGSNDEPRAPAVIVFGVTGSGKSLIGKQLAQQLGWAFHDADDYHSPENLDKLKRGIALTDDDRWPWLDRLRQVIVEAQARREPIVLASSALKRVYRRRLDAGSAVTFVYLKADKPLIAERLRQRSGHFMNPDLIDSQFATLEEPRADEHAIVVDASAAPDEIIRQIKAALTG